MISLEQALEQNYKNIESLQSAMSTLAEAFQLKLDPASVSAAKTYRVKSGDSLEKIAKLHGTTIRALKELNGITSDKIIVGTWLKIP